MIALVLDKRVKVKRERERETHLHKKTVCHIIIINIMSSKLDYLKKYTNNQSKEQLKKRLLKQLSKEDVGDKPVVKRGLQRFNDEEGQVLTFGTVKKQGPKNDNMIIQNKGFVPMNEEVYMPEEEEDIQPVIVGEDFGL